MLLSISDSNKNKYDFFYINPPYGSKNERKSRIVWLERCMSLCVRELPGIIIILYDEKISCTVKYMANIQAFLIRNGFAIKDMTPNIHHYHFPNYPNHSSGMLRSRVTENCDQSSSSFVSRTARVWCISRILCFKREASPPAWVLTSAKFRWTLDEQDLKNA